MLTRALGKMLFVTGVLIPANGSGAFARGDDVGLAEPDLVAVSVDGPDGARTGEIVTIHVVIGNEGDDPIEDYTAEIVLSADATVSADDRVVFTLQTVDIGGFALPVEIPADLVPGTYCYGLRIQPAVREQNTSNNTVLGPPVGIESIDLQVTDSSPLVVFLRQGDAEAPSPSFTIENAGSTGSLLFFSVEADAPFVSVDPALGFAVGGEVGQDVTVTIDPTVLTVGVFEVSIVARDLHDADDFEVIPLTIEVGDPKFNAGDRVHGLIGEPGDVDEIVFDAVEGMKLRVKTKTSSGDLLPTLTLVDPDGLVESEVKFKHVDAFLKKTLKLSKSGEYRLIIAGRNGTSGNYKVKTGRAFSKKGQPRSVVVTAVQDEVEIHALAGAKLSFSVKPSVGFASAPLVELRSPSDQEVDVSGFVVAQADGALVVEGLDLTEAGVFRLRVAGFDGAPGESCEVDVVPVQPQKTKDKIFLP